MVTSVAIQVVILISISLDHGLLVHYPELTLQYSISFLVFVIQIYEVKDRVALRRKAPLHVRNKTTTDQM